MNFLYNLDRAFASLFGAKPQETISSEIARNAPELCPYLDILGPDHCEHAKEHADKLNKADDGQEQ